MISKILIALVALIHIYILVLEMFLWETPRGLRVFGLKPEFARATRALAANQGLYNGFLAAGLIWALLLGAGGYSIAMFFLGCVIIAGLYGAATVNRRILFVQTIPASLAWLAVLAGF